MARTDSLEHFLTDAAAAIRLKSGTSAQMNSNEMINTLNNRGKILSIDKQPDGAYEIWIKDEFENNETFVYYLFNYDIGVVNCSDE